MPIRAIVTFTFFVLSIVALTSQARADYFVWEDPETGLSLSFPDTWRRGNNKKPDDLITILAPSGEENARCVVTATDDHRFLIYPPRYDVSIQKVAYSKNFWDSYMSVKDNVRFHVVKDQTGLGRGVGSSATASYDTSWPEPFARRTAIMSVSLYSGTAYLVNCSAEEHAFAKWQPLFMSVMKSIDFKKAYHENVTGHYSNFLKHRDLMFPDKKKHFYMNF